MNKQRFLTELQRLLVFMTEEDRAYAAKYYEALFDQAGPDGEEALLAEIGSPTKAAIELSRGYEEGKLAEKLGPLPTEEKAALTESEPDPWGDLPVFELPDLPDFLEEESPEEKEAAKQPEAAEKPKEAEKKGEHPAARPVEETETAASTERPEVPAQKRKNQTPTPVKEPVRTEMKEETVRQKGAVPLGVGVPLFVLFMLVIGVPLGVLFLALAVVCVCPGLGGLGIAVLFVIGAMWCVSYIADTILVLGAGLLVLAVAILVLWCGIWLISRLVKLYSLIVGGLSGVLLGRKVKTDA